MEQVHAEHTVKDGFDTGQGGGGAAHGPGGEEEGERAAEARIASPAGGAE